jgi:hypothetical protein
MALIGENGRPLENDVVVSTTFQFTVTFDGTAGKGAVGALTIPTFTVPAGTYVTQAYADVQTPLVGADSAAYVTVGIATDDPDAALDAYTGLVTSLNSNGTTQILTPSLLKATATRAIVAAVAGSAITAGVLKVTLILQK